MSCVCVLCVTSQSGLGRGSSITIEIRDESLWYNQGLGRDHIQKFM